MVLETVGEARTQVADRYRADVQAAGRGDGAYGFSLPLSAFPARAEVACRWSDGTPLPGSPWREGLVTVGRTRTVGWLTLHEDVAGQGLASGWAVDRRDPFRRLSLEATVNGRVVASGRACLYRASALGEGGDGFHGYAFPVPPGQKVLVSESARAAPTAAGPS